MRTFATILLMLSLSACKEEETPAKATYILQPGEEQLIEIKTPESKMISFGFDIDSPIKRDSTTCEDPDDTGFPYCGRLAQVSETGEETGSTFSSWHGGGLVFTPSDGMIRVKLISLALVELEFEVEITDP